MGDNAERGRDPGAGPEEELPGTPSDLRDRYVDPGRAGLLRRILDETDLEGAVFVTAGAVSGCWSRLEGAGVFESQRAKDHCDALVQWIKDHYVPKEAS